MNEKTIAVADLEQIYDALAEGLDQAGEKQHSLYLTKLVLILSARLNNKDMALQAIKDSLKDL